MMYKKQTNGFSLVEVLIAIGVVSVGLLALLAVFISGTRSNEHGKDVSNATHYARKICEVIRARNLAFTESSIPPPADSGLNDGANVWRALDDAPLLDIRRRKVDDDGNVVMNGADPVLLSGDEKFERHIEMARASTNSNDYNYGNVIVDVWIRWRDGKTVGGHRQVRVSTMVRQG